MVITSVPEALFHLLVAIEWVFGDFGNSFAQQDFYAFQIYAGLSKEGLVEFLQVVMINAAGG